ncbi:hypothetical protein [Brachybacterium kimchii]|uniref:Uncharacterized protein n=1 Tax=Brachybacterium kimchii TaxID=2942909 RepID=A0ABY4NCK6_9MICO|nr:hypothetical protein [Brachybacterium kimchii]UQN31204.1 hypothetical protein M4486_07970 [Brachybacterium kimchii]
MTAVGPGVVLLLLVAAVVAVLMVLAALGKLDLSMPAPGADHEHRRPRRAAVRGPGRRWGVGRRRRRSAAASGEDASSDV